MSRYLSLHRQPTSLVASLAVAGLVTLLSSNPAQATVGTQVLLQTWKPQQPEVQGLSTAARSPSLVSDTLAQFWRSRGRADACRAIAQALGQAPTRVYDIDCRLSDQVDVQASAGANGQLQLSLVVLRNVLLAKAEIDVVPDPRFSIDFDLRVDLTLAVSNKVAQPLSVSQAQARVTNVHADSQNFVADLAALMKNIVAYVGGPDFQRAAELALESRSIDFRAQANASMSDINAQLQLPATLPGHVRVGVWSRPGMVTVAYAPLLETVGGAAMEGAVHWDAAALEVSSCADLKLSAVVQVGPRPLTNPEGALGVAPQRTVGSMRQTQSAAGSCDYRLEGLGVGMPHRLEADMGSAARPVKQRPQSWTLFALQPDGWDGVAVTPQPLASARNFVVRSGQVKAAFKAGAETPSAKMPRRPGVSDGPIDGPIRGPFRADLPKLTAPAAITPSTGAVPMTPMSAGTAAKTNVAPSIAAKSLAARPAQAPLPNASPQ
jgi:hypothetical protein